MGSYRSTYPMMSEENQSTSAPHFAWFHPGNYMAAMRTGINPFQGSRHNPEGNTPMPSISIPINQLTNVHEPETEPEPEPEPELSKPTKKPKNSRKKPNDGSPKEPNPKKLKKGSQRRTSRKNPNDESSIDDGGSLLPFCTCTGEPRQCYRWGSGGWQSACCTINISEYPLPMSATRPGSRTPGRKMSHGAFMKLLKRLGSEGFDLTVPIDLKDHWARHGTNKFVIIK